MVKRRKDSANRQLLLVLVVATLVVSLVGTWLVLQNGIAATHTSTGGTVSFDKAPNAPSVVNGNTVDTGVVSFVKAG
jgi:hypothetical protein